MLSAASERGEKEDKLKSVFNVMGGFVKNPNSEDPSEKENKDGKYQVIE